MTKIDFEDDGYKVHRKTGNKIARAFLTVIGVLIILMAGGFGGIAGVFLLSSNDGALAKRLGVENLSIPTIKTEKIVVEESNAIIEASNKVSSAVVSVTLKTTVQNIFGQTSEVQGAGTGFIITSDGLVLTNKHVANDPNATYTVITNDEKTYDAKIQSVDPFNDIAVLKIDARNLPVVELGDSDQLKVGQWVVAVGNALGQFQNTVTSGIISAKDRKIQASDSDGTSTETLSNLLQTDAPINSGNSGGPLVNLAGQVVGINTAVAANAQGIGFAIPINEAKSAIESIKKSGKIIRPYLGVRYIEVNKALAEENNLSVDYGALIQRGSKITDFAVSPGSPADKAGLTENDIILEIDGQKVDENHSLVKLIQEHQVGDEVTLKVLSKGQEKTVKVKLEESK